MAPHGTNGDDGTHGSESMNIPLLINNKEIETTTTFDIVSPSTGLLVWKSSSASKQDAIAAAEAAKAAFPAWSKTKPSYRRDIFLKAADILEKRGAELAGYMMTETGSQPPFASGVNIPLSVGMLRDIAGRIVTISGTVPVCDAEGTSAILYKEPYGVVLGIAPWNAPYILGFRSIAFALAAGNTTILKSSELSPRCHWAIGSVFKEAGLPAGCLNVICHRKEDAAEVTAALIEHPAIQKINFTGSTAVGRIIASIAGKNLKPCLLELGGKAGALVLADANLEKAAQACAVGAFLHSGQVCMSTERIVVHSSIASAFSAQFKMTASRMFGLETPCPVLVTSAGVKKNQSLISDALSKGGKLLLGDIDAPESSDTRMRATIVEGVTKNMEIYHEESFGPSVSLIVVESEEEAIAVANDTDYGLTSAVFTENLATGLRVARQIQSGAVHINSMTIHDEPNLPHGGVKSSGWGRFMGNSGLDEFLKTKTVTWQD